jgi:hypothetical protein
MKAAAASTRLWPAALRLFAFIIVALVVAAAIASLLRGYPLPANPERHFRDTNNVAVPPLGGLGAVPIPPAL